MPVRKDATGGIIYKDEKPKRPALMRRKSSKEKTTKSYWERFFDEVDRLSTLSFEELFAAEEIKIQ